MKINLTAIINSIPEHTDKVKRILKDMVIQSKKESACIQYELHQDTEKPNLFLFHEIWDNAESLAKHNQQPYIKAFGEIINEKLQEAPTIYQTKII